MEPQMNQDEKNIEALIEAQARGEQIVSVVTDDSVAPDTQLDLRTSKVQASTLNELFNGTNGLGTGDFSSPL